MIFNVRIQKIPNQILDLPMNDSIPSDTKKATYDIFVDRRGGKLNYLNYFK